eukprot:jgi/Mesvir1/2136/Mv16657-RA.1
MTELRAMAADVAEEKFSEFSNVCKDVLALDGATSKQAWELFREMLPLASDFATVELGQQGGDRKGTVALWQSLALFAVCERRKLRDAQAMEVDGGDEGRGGAAPPLDAAKTSLSSILAALGVSWVTFLKEVNAMALKAAPTLAAALGVDDLEELLKVRHIEACFLHSIMFFFKYGTLFRKYVRPHAHLPGDATLPHGMLSPAPLPLGGAGASHERDKAGDKEKEKDKDGDKDKGDKGDKGDGNKSPDKVVKSPDAAEDGVGDVPLFATPRKGLHPHGADAGNNSSVAATPPRPLRASTVAAVAAAHSMDLMATPRTTLHTRSEYGVGAIAGGGGAPLSGVKLCNALREDTLFCLGWETFVLARARIGAAEDRGDMDMVRSFHLLLAVLDWMLAHAPGHLPFDNATLFPTGPGTLAGAEGRSGEGHGSAAADAAPEKGKGETDKGGDKGAEKGADKDKEAGGSHKEGKGGLDVLRSLCVAHKAVEKHLRSLAAALHALVEEVLGPVGATHAKRRPHPSPLLAPGTEHWEGLLDPANVPACRARLQEAYLRGLGSGSSAHLNELDFLRGLGDGTAVGNTSLLGMAHQGRVGAPPARSGYDKLSADAQMPSPLRRAIRAPGLSQGPAFSSPCPTRGGLAGGGLQAMTPTRPLHHPPLAPHDVLANVRTPVSDAMAGSLWLHTAIDPLPDSPSAELQRLLSLGGRASPLDVRGMFTAYALKVFPESHRPDVRDVSTGRRLLATKLFLRMLEHILRGEEGRLAPASFAQLISNEAFHRAIAACCLEVVVGAYRVAPLAFPEVATRIGLKPFDMLKVIESFIKSEPSLPRPLKSHLRMVEESVVEQLAWERGSSLYHLLVKAEAARSAAARAAAGEGAEPGAGTGDGANGNGDAPAEAGRAPPPPSPGGSRVASTGPPSSRRMPTAAASAFQVFCSSPLRPTAAPAPAPAGSGVDAAAGAATSAAAAVAARPALPTSLAMLKRSPAELSNSGAFLCNFFEKVERLSAVRMTDLCDRLQLQHSVLQQVYSVFSSALHQHTSLFYNRHIDQVMLCAIYGVCKAARESVQFRDILMHYRKQPQSKQEVFRSVAIEQDRQELTVTRRGDIIVFYNFVFIPEMKDSLLQVTARGAAQVPMPSAGGSVLAEASVVSGPGRSAQPGGSSAPSGGGGGTAAVAARPASGAAPPDADEPSSPVREPASTTSGVSFRSPSKISSSHNIYVSPLRPHKAEMYMSPQSQTLYATVGLFEGTKAYESPARDLHQINLRVASSRKLDLGTDLVNHASQGSHGSQGGSGGTAVPTRLSFEARNAGAATAVGAPCATSGAMAAPAAGTTASTRTVSDGAAPAAAKAVSSSDGALASDSVPSGSTRPSSDVVDAAAALPTARNGGLVRPREGGGGSPSPTAKRARGSDNGGTVA